jgi:hypothetical protein
MASQMLLMQHCEQVAEAEQGLHGSLAEASVERKKAGPVTARSDGDSKHKQQQEQ